MFNGKKEMMKTITRSNGRKYTTKNDINRFFFPKEYIALENSLKPNAKFTIQLLLNTGCRINEARNIKVSDIDLENRRIVLRVTKTKASKGENKGKIRIIPISGSLVRVIKKRLKSRAMPLNSTLGVLSTSGVKLALQRACTKLGMQNPNDFSAHSLRKTFEVWLMALGVGDMKLLSHLGHDMKTAMRYYISPDVFNYEEKLMIREVLGDLYK